MAVIKLGDVVAVFVDRSERLLCLDCFMKEGGELDDVNFDDVLTEEEIDSTDDLYFCDNGGHNLRSVG